MAISLTWAHRDRLLQADQVIEWVAAGIGPEPGAHYRLRIRTADNTLVAEHLEIASDNATVTTNYTGLLFFELTTLCNGHEAWHPVRWSESQAVPDAVDGTFINATQWTGGEVIPDQPHGEALLADDVLPLEQLSNEDETDFLFSD